MFLLLLYAAMVSAMAADAWTAEIDAWRAAAERRLKAEDGWLTVAGLHWLTPGEVKFGSDETLPIVLPSGSPKHSGTFLFDGRTVRMRPAPGVAIRVNGKPAAKEQVVKSDHGGPSDAITLGDVTLLVIQRGPRTGIRIKDKNGRYRREFTRRNWFPVDAAYRVEAKYTPYPAPVKRMVPTVLEGVVEEQEGIGTVAFTLQGQKLKLEALRTTAGQIWFVFKDSTAGKQTYAAARFLYAMAPKDGRTTLDFNKAYNPPCAFNPYTTCPIPVKQNVLPVAIEAGELKY